MAVEIWNPVIGFEWVTRHENMFHASVNGLLATGERHGRYTQPEAFRHGR